MTNERITYKNYEQATKPATIFFFFDKKHVHYTYLFYTIV